MKLSGGIAVALAACASACATAPTAQPQASNSYANYLVGRLATLRDDHQAASDRLYRALMASPGDATLMDGVVGAALATGDADRAREVARMRVATGQTPGGYVQIVRAVEAMDAGRWRVAREALENAHGDPGAQLMGRLLLVWAKTGDGHVDDVTGELGRLTNMRPYGGLFAFQQAMALDVAGRRDAALTAYQTAENAGLFLAPGTERHADLLARSGSRDQALAVLRSSEARTANASLQAAAARVEAGGSASAQPLNAVRGAAVGLYGLAAIFQQERGTSQALAALTLANMLDPDLDAARIAFAENQADLHHPDGVRAALARIPEGSPYAESAKIMAAWELKDEGRNDEAVALAQQTAATGTWRARRALADLYRSLSRFSDAEPIYTALIESSPQPDWRLYYSRGLARSELNRWPEAETDMRQALQISPDQPEVLNYLGYSWVDRGERLQEGLAMIQRAAEIRPMSGAIIDSLGWAYFQLGRYDLAVENLEHAVELQPADVTLNDHLGDAYWRTDRPIEARFQWQRALSLNPSATMRTAIQTKLDHGLPAPRTAHR